MRSPRRTRKQSNGPGTAPALREIGIVADVAEPLGIARGELLAAVESQPVKDALKVAVDEAIAEGVFGVPTFIVDGVRYWGQDRLGFVDRALEALRGVG